MKLIKTNNKTCYNVKGKIVDMNGLIAKQHSLTTDVTISEEDGIMEQEFIPVGFPSRPHWSKDKREFHLRRKRRYKDLCRGGVNND